MKWDAEKSRYLLKQKAYTYAIALGWAAEALRGWARGWGGRQNTGLASLLARMEGILGAPPPWMLARGRYAHRFYTRSGAVYRQVAHTVRIPPPLRAQLHRPMRRACNRDMQHAAGIICV